VRFRFGGFRPRLADPAREARLSPIVVSFQLRAEALGPILLDDAQPPRAGPAAAGGYLKIRQRKQTADWQLLVSDRFTGARNPARLTTTNANPSNPLRPPFNYHFTIPISLSHEGALSGC